MDKIEHAIYNLIYNVKSISTVCVSVNLKHLYTTIVRITNKHKAILIYGYPPRASQVTNARSFLPKGMDEFPRRVKYRDTVIMTFSHVHIVSTDTQSCWSAELTLAPPPLANVTQIPAILTEHNNLVFVRIDNINISLGVKVNVPWVFELAWTITMGTKCLYKV